MRRFAPTFAGIVGVGLVMAIVSGTAQGVGLFGLLVLGGLLLLASGRLRHKRPAADPGWVPVHVPDFVPSVDDVPAPSSRVAAALGRAEARQLVSSGSFGVGLGFCLVLVVLFGIAYSPDFEDDLPSLIELFPIFAHPLVGMTVLAAHRARTRSVRDGAQELFGVCPTTEATRTAGHLMTAWVPAVTTLAFLGVLGASAVIRVEAAYGPIGARQAAHLGGAVVLAVGGIVLGVALGRSAPWTPVPVVVVAAVGLLTIQLSTAGERSTDGIRQLSTWLSDPEVEIRFTAPHWLAHHLWVVALVALVAVLALLRERRHSSLLAAGAAAAAIAVVAGIVATRPIDAADASRIAALLADPAAHQTCLDAGVPICTYDGDVVLADRLAPDVDAVAAAVPAGALDGWSIRQGADVDRSKLDPAIARLVPKRPHARIIPVELVVHDLAAQGARFWVALTAVGVTEELTPGTTPSLAGQARGVVALWLATRQLDDVTATEMTSVKRRPGPDPPADASRPWPDTCHAGPVPVR